MKGEAAIYAFRVRSYGERDLPILEGVAPDGARVKLYPLFTARQQGSPLSPDVPFEI